MFDLTWDGWAILAIASLLIGLSKTALPGVGTIAVALFAFVLPAKMSTAAILVLLLCADLIAIYTYRRDADWKILRALFPTVLAGIITGAIFLFFANDIVMKRSIGVILLGLVAITLFSKMRSRQEQDRTSAKVTTNPFIRGFYGALGGFTTMAANAGGPVMSLYFLAARFDVTRFLGTSAWFFFIVNLTKLPFSAGLGLISSSSLLTNLALLPFVLIGAFGGRSLAKRMSNKVFDPIVLVLTIVSSVALLF